MERAQKPRRNRQDPSGRRVELLNRRPEGDHPARGRRAHLMQPDRSSPMAAEQRVDLIHA